MRTQSAPIDNRTTALVPPIICEHGDDVASVEARAGFELCVQFHDGTYGVVHMRDLISSPGAGVFAELRNPDVFAMAGVYLGAVTWPTGQDLAPDAMYEAFRDKGEWTPR